MFHLLVLMFCLPFYIMYWVLKIFIYSIVVIVSVISAISTNRNTKVKKEAYIKEKSIEKQDIVTNSTDVKSISNSVKNTYPIEIERYYIVEPSELQYEITVNKIQELYRELGFDVKVIDIKKNKYNTEYEISFSQSTTQYEILSVSEKIIEEFNIDGIRIKGASKNANRINIFVPLEYKKQSKALT